MADPRQGQVDAIVTDNRVIGVETGIAFTDGADGVTRDNLTSGVTVPEALSLRR